MNKLPSLLKIMIFPLCFFFGEAALAKKKSKSRDDARVIFQKTSHDFGQVVRGQRLSFQFPFKNEGSSSLKFLRVERSCPCLSIQENKKSYASQQEGHLLVELATATFLGVHEKTFKVYTNDLARPEIEFSVKADIVPEFLADPPVVDFGRVTLEQTPQDRHFVIRGQKSYLFQVKELMYDRSLFDIDYHQSVEDPSQWIFKVTLKKLEKEKFLKEKLVLLTNSTNLPQLEVYILAQLGERK